MVEAVSTLVMKNKFTLPLHSQVASGKDNCAIEPEGYTAQEPIHYSGNITVRHLPDNPKRELE